MVLIIRNLSNLDRLIDFWINGKFDTLATFQIKKRELLIFESDSLDNTFNLADGGEQEDC